MSVEIYFPEKHIAVVELVRPDRGNSLTPALLESLTDAVQKASEKDTRVGILRGRGDRSFCTGYDLEHVSTPLEPKTLRLEPAAQALEASPFPWLCFVNGRTMGGAFELLLACDFRIAVSSATFRMPALRLAVPYSAEGLRRFVKVIGPAKTLDLFATAREFDCDEALRLGLVERQGTFDDALAWARAASESGPIALRYTKSAIHAIIQGEDPDNVPDLVRLRQTCLTSRDLQEGFEAALNGRLPEFRGQ